MRAGAAALLAEGKSDARARRRRWRPCKPSPTSASRRAVLDAYPKLSAALRGQAQTLLCSRPASALAFLQAVDAGKINPKEVPLDQLRASPATRTSS